MASAVARVIGTSVSVSAHEVEAPYVRPSRPSAASHEQQSQRNRPVTRYKMRFPERAALQEALSGPELATTQRRRTDWKRNTLIVEMDGSAGPQDGEREQVEEMARTSGASMIPEFQYDIDDIFEAGPESPDDPTLDDVKQMIRADRVWGWGRGKGVTIAVIDTGVEGSRPEFRYKKHLHGGLATPDFTTAWEDPRGHGTMCAAIVAGEGGMGTARDGAAPEASVLPCRSKFRDSEIVMFYNQQIERARKGEIIVVTNSFGIASGQAPPAPQDTDLLDVLREAEEAGIHIFFSAGNNHEAAGAAHSACGPNSIWLHKSYDFLTAVGTCDLERRMWSYSSRGPRQVFELPGTNAKPDLIAPTPRNGRIAYGAADRTLTCGWGTTGACPQVAGMAALLLSINPRLSPRQVREILRGATTQFPNVSVTCRGARVLDCSVAIATVGQRKAPRRRHGKGGAAR